jgi:FkbM family methyltransferase
MILLEKLLIHLSDNTTAQGLIGRGIERLQFLAGFGSGANPSKSGESAVADLLIEHLTRTAPVVVFDVGANNGGFGSMIRAKLGDQNFAMHSFEPGQMAFRLLKEKFSNDSRFCLNNCALGAAVGERQLHYFQEGSTLASLTRRRLDHFRRPANQPSEPLSEIVKISTIDTYLNQMGIAKIDLLKVDVEGHEMDVFNGAQEAFRRGAIRMLTFEFGGCNIDTRIFFQDYWYLFAQFSGAKIFRITPSGFLYRIWKYRENLEVFRASNYLVTF